MSPHGKSLWSEVARQEQASGVAALVSWWSSWDVSREFLGWFGRGTAPCFATTLSLGTGFAEPEGEPGIGHVRINHPHFALGVNVQRHAVCFRYPSAPLDSALPGCCVSLQPGYLLTPKAAFGRIVSVSRMRGARPGALTGARRQCPTSGWTLNHGADCLDGRRYPFL